MHARAVTRRRTAQYRSDETMAPSGRSFVPRCGSRDPMHLDLGGCCRIRARFADRRANQIETRATRDPQVIAPPYAKATRDPHVIAPLGAFAQRLVKRLPLQCSAAVATYGSSSRPA